jgi:hypothetical protein
MKTVVTRVRCVLIMELCEIIGFSLRCKCRETNISAFCYYVYDPSLKYISYTPRCGKFVEVPLPKEHIEAFGRMAWSCMQWYLLLGSACPADGCFSWVKWWGVKVLTVQWRTHEFFLLGGGFNKVS